MLEIWTEKTTNSEVFRSAVVTRPHSSKRSLMKKHTSKRPLIKNIHQKDRSSKRPLINKNTHQKHISNRSLKESKNQWDLYRISTEVRASGTDSFTIPMDEVTNSQQVVWNQITLLEFYNKMCAILIRKQWHNIE